MSSKITGRRSSILSLLTALVTPLALLIAFMAALSYTSLVNAAGSITVEIIAGYNLVVDSNVEAPSTAAPSVATVIGRVCNTSTVTLNNVSVSIGDYANNTPGIYPVRLASDLTGPLYNTVGSYSFTHIGGTADATRLIPTLAPGECKVEYWHFTYPRCENNPDGTPASPPCDYGATWGDSIKPDDDLWLTFDVWATESDGSVATDTWKMTMRNEIAAMANKVEPNPLGQWFNTESNTVEAGGLITTNGILYELGVINKGFDNDGDLIYDYNAWLQPIGDPSFDPTCFRLMRTTGVLTVSRGAGQRDAIIPFTDTLYFTNLPPDNTGVRGLVFYTFMAIRGSCATSVSPYQEVASGADNEKFNGDYGVAPPPPSTTPPEVSLDKTGNITVTAGSQITYTVSLSNAGPNSAGMPSVGMPLVLSDTMPVSTTFITNSTTTSVTILYSTDHGQTYTTTPPVPASTVTNVQWWLTSPLTAGASIAFTFSVEVDSVFPPAGADPYINNCADVSFGGATPFDEDCAPTLVAGSYSIGDRVWRDENLDRLQTTGELSISNISLYLYYDKNGDRVLDSGDPQIMTTTTSVTGWYNFAGLISGTYIVKVNGSDPDLPTGYRNTTPITYATQLSSTHTSDLAADFGFGPSLTVAKTASYDGQYVRYSIPIANQRPGGGTPVAGGCQYEVWVNGYDASRSGTGNKAFLNPQNAYSPPGPDRLYATAPYGNAGEQLALWGFNLGLAKPGNIVKVEVLLPVVKYGNFASTAVFHAAVMTSATTLQSHSSHIFYPADLTSGTWITDVTADRASWDWSLFNGNTLGCFLESYRGTGATDGHIDLDAAGYRITSDAPCVAGDPDDAITSVPLTDTYTYDTSLLQFVSASPPQSGINTTAGVITWTNVGPIDPGQTANIQVTFRALPRTSSFLITNTACVSGATFSDGQPVNDACGSVTNLFTPTGIISGVVWARNGTATDWYDSTGYYSTDWRIPNVTVMLYECVWDDGSGAVYGTDVSPNKDCTAQSKAGGAKGIITPTDIAVTDQSGAYTFTGLLNGFYYVGIDTASLPAGYSEAADPGNQGNGTGSWCLGTPGTCDNRWITDSVWLRIADLNPIGDGSGSASDSYSEVISNVNFGYTNTLAAIYGTIWEDHDRDGSRDAGDQGLDTGTAGITVTLRNLAGTPVYTTQTNASGYYLFTNVTPGTYTITVVSSTLPPGGTWTQTYDPDALCVPTKQSGCDDAHTVVNLLAGQISGSHDFGYYRGGEYSIGDTVYTDWNGNGTQDSGEEGLAGITVTLYADSNANGVYDLAQDALITSTTTSAAGTYLFTGLVTGTYFVVADTSGLPSWWDDYRETQDPDEGGVCTSCNSRGTAVVSSAHTSELDMDFGYQPVGFSTIGDYVWHDANRDGFQGATETGISGVVVQLYEDGNGNGFIDPEDALVMTKTTNSAGYYLFDSLLTHLQSMTGTHGEYLVQVVTSTVITDVYGNPYVLTTQSNPISVSLSTGQNYLDADFGFAAGGRIGDRIWQDNNGNGNQDLGEPGISGVTVTLYIAGNDIPYLTATTSLTGFYCFNSLPAGNYVVVVDTSTLVGLTQTGDPDIGQFNPCRNPITGEPMACDSQSSLHLAVGQEDLSRDFGYQPALYIGDRVWLDTNNYGVQDNVSGNTDPGSVSEIYTEPGIAGVVITLTNQSGGVVTTTTDSDGRYSFGGLAPNSTYTVTVSAGTLPAGVQPTWEYSTTTSPGGQVTVTTGVTSVTSIGGLDCTNCNMAVDFGYAYATGSYSISGTAYHDDVTTDGYLYKPYTTEDSPMTCTVLIYLWMDTGGGDFTQIDSTWTTLSTGLYTFTNLAAGNYRVSTSPVAPNGMVNTTGNIRTPLAEAPIVLSSTHTSSVDNDFGFAGPGYPTAIELASFTARNRAGASPLVEWVTAMELHNLGFNLYRTDSPNKLPGREQRLNDSLIPSQSPGSLMGAAYAYADEMAVAGVIYYYWLEAIDNKGVADLYGPVSTADSVDTTTPSTSSPIYLPIVIKPGQ